MKYGSHHTVDFQTYLALAHFTYPALPSHMVARAYVDKGDVIGQIAHRLAFVKHPSICAYFNRRFGTAQRFLLLLRPCRIQRNVPAHVGNEIRL